MCHETFAGFKEASVHFKIMTTITSTMYVENICSKVCLCPQFPSSASQILLENAVLNIKELTF